ncbi:MAG: DMT family transporter [Rhizobiales bacterium]|nr:DMT family transporter [Hyphomicrobiales bacterium]
MPPWTLAFLRWVLACLILAPFALGQIRARARAIRTEWHRIVLLGFLGMWISGGVVYLSLQFTTATNATLIYTVSPALVVLFAAILARRPLLLMQALGVMFGVAGVAIIVLEGDLTAVGSLDFNRGDLGMIAAAIAWAIYSLVLKRSALDAIPTLALFFAIAIAGMITLTSLMAYEAVTVGRFPITLNSWISILGLAIFPSVLSFSFYQYGIKTVGPSSTAIFMCLLPPYGVMLAVVFLGERLHLYHWVGFAMVLGGVILATSAELRPRL